MILSVGFELSDLETREHPKISHRRRRDGSGWAGITSVCRTARVGAAASASPGSLSPAAPKQLVPLPSTRNTIQALWCELFQLHRGPAEPPCCLHSVVPFKFQYRGSPIVPIGPGASISCLFRFIPLVSRLAHGLLIPLAATPPSFPTSRHIPAFLHHFN